MLILLLINVLSSLNILGFLLPLLMEFYFYPYLLMPALVFVGLGPLLLKRLLPPLSLIVWSTCPRVCTDSNVPLLTCDLGIDGQLRLCNHQLMRSI